MDNYEELDSFTEEMIKRTQLRQLALNNSADNRLNGSASSSSSTETPVTYIDDADEEEESEHSYDDKDTSVRSDSSGHKRHMLRAAAETTDTTAVSQESESPPKKRMSLNSRLNSISKMIDESSNGKSKTVSEKLAANDSTVKSKACVDALNDLSDQKRAPLRDRLNAMARMYTSDEQFEYEPTKQPEIYPKSPQKKSANAFSISTASKSPMKKLTPLAKSGDNGRVDRSPQINNNNNNKNENVSIEESNNANNNCVPKSNYFAAKLILTSNSVNVKKDSTDKCIFNNTNENRTEKKSPNASNDVNNKTFIVDKKDNTDKRIANKSTNNENQTEKKSSNDSNKIINKTFIVATDKKIVFENVREMSAKNTDIINSPKVITTPVNVSDVRKRFETKSDSKPNDIIIKKPEILSVTAKTDLFEKAILAECDAKSKMYARKRMAAQPNKQNKIIENSSPTTYNTIINSNITSKQNKISENSPNLSNSNVSPPQPILSEETLIKTVKSSEEIFDAKSGVSDNIATRAKILQQRLLMGTTTANAVCSEVEARKKELDMLKRPIRRKLSDDGVAKSNDNNNDKMIGNNQSEINTKITCDGKRDDEEEAVDNRNDTIDDSIDSEKAHQTICDVFNDIDSYVLEDMSPAMSKDSSKIGNSCNTTPNNEIDSIKFEFESPTKRNRLYPDLVTLDECHNIHESPPPAKPPRTAGNSACNLKPNTPLRTISFYRKEQQMKVSNNTTPVVQTIVYGHKEKPKSSNIDTNRIKPNEIQDKIRKLTEEVQNQNRITGQASQALALCLEKDEFKGSIERVEAEKLLLESGQKRIAYLNEIKRLNDLLSPDKALLKSDKSKGCLSLSNIQLSVSGEFLVKRAEQRDNQVYHYICIIYNKANVYVTNVLNSVEHIKNGALEFYFGFSMPDLAADFQVGIHVYEMATPKQSVSHETKYHIKKTPKKGKRNMQSPAIRSPGGPSAVLSTSFSLVGKVNLNIRNWNRKSMILENFNPNSKLAGSIATHMSLKVIHDYKADGFLNLSNSSGCWSQRWFVLRRHLLAYWRFPDDINKEPLGGIDLMDCINPKVCTVSREVCSRKNTFSLITLPIIENKSRNGGSVRRANTPIGYLLSSDIKEECTEWCDKLTELLDSIRLWETGCATPVSEADFDNCLKYANFSN